ncbi:MAG: hypothetical protein GVY24_07475 [Planctomycetes bacterium]|jgi:hypothetical protein|nr:hypothetical protein [Planctomycetota bacterium]
MRTPRISPGLRRVAGPTLAIGFIALLGWATPTPAAAGDIQGKARFGQRHVDRHHDRGFHVSIRFGDRDRGHRYHRGHGHKDRHHGKHKHGERYDRGHHPRNRYDDKHHRGKRYEHRYHKAGHHRGIDHRRCGYYKKVWIPPRYLYRYDACGRRYRVLIKPGCYRRVWVAQCHHRRTFVCR